MNLQTRNKLIRNLRTSGSTCSDLAATFGISRQRVAQIAGVTEATARMQMVAFERCVDRINFVREDIPEQDRSFSTKLHHLYIAAEKAMTRFQRAIQ